MIATNPRRRAALWIDRNVIGLAVLSVAMYYGFLAADDFFLAERVALWMLT